MHYINRKKSVNSKKVLNMLFRHTTHPANNNHPSISVITKCNWTKTQLRMIIIQ
ncbi:Uncharacterised protein [Klebsiella pneumoniae]|nr:Uncharacterised protein [Klebsiella pneumoniae]